MRFDMPALGLAPYLSLAAIVLLAAALPGLVVRRKTLAANLRGALVVAALVLPVVLVLGLSMRHNTLELRDGQVVVRAGYFYEYARDIAEFDLARARQGSQAVLVPEGFGVRDNGIRLPGYAAGRFGAGGDSLFVAVTDSERLVYLPARHGQSLLVSVEQGNALLQALYRRGAAFGPRLGSQD